jgi:diaminohydroxyphosphoribosylaminopyrimidine deaminase / 5-amino-6-(5-phosphoribosylamino)uracil reductase
MNVAPGSAALDAPALMARALALAAKGRASTHPNPRVGCVIVRGGVIIGEGAHLQAGEPHAEVHALRMAGEDARGADVFVTLEPCNHHGRTPPCTEALIAAGVARVWAAMVDPNPLVAGQGLARLQAAGIATHTGLLRDAALALNRGFVRRMTQQRPFVTLKLAAGLDGRTAMASGESRWITGAAARADVHRLRAEAGAVLTSSATALADDPALTVRDWFPDAGSLLRQPDRIVLDSAGRVPAQAAVWAEGARRFWFTARQPARVPDGVQNLVMPRQPHGLDLPAVLRALAAEHINELLVECGPNLAGALLQAGLVDELALYLAPRLLGHEARPLVTLPGLGTLAAAPHLHISDSRMVGDDLRLTAIPLYSERENT